MLGIVRELSRYSPIIPMKILRELSCRNSRLGGRRVPFLGSHCGINLVAPAFCKMVFKAFSYWYLVGNKDI